MPIGSSYSSIIYCIGFIILLGSCRAIKPDAPDKLPISKIPEYEQPVSVINIPISVELKPYFDETEKAVPTTFSGEESQCDGVSVWYLFKRDPIQFKGTGSDIKLDVDGSYSMKMNYCPSCTEFFSSEGNCIVPRLYASCGVGEAMPKIHISFSSKIGINSNYGLTAKTKLQSVKAITPCRVTLFNYNATKHVEDEVSKALRAVEKDIDKEIQSISLKSEMQELWDMLRDPIDLEGYGKFYINPKSAGIDKLNYSGSRVTFNAVLNANPHISFGDSVIEKEQLPSLQEITKKDGFEINMDIQARYDSLSYLTNKEIAGTTFEVKGREVIIDSISFFPYGDQLGVHVKFSGKKNGRLYLVGNPQLDTNTQILSIPNIEFDVRTKSLLLKSAKWLFDKKITEMIRSYAVIDLKPYLDDIKQEINTSLNGELTEGVYLEGLVNDAKVLSIHPLADHLYIRSMGKGKLAIRM